MSHLTGYLELAAIMAIVVGPPAAVVALSMKPLRPSDEDEQPDEGEAALQEMYIAGYEAARNELGQCSPGEEPMKGVTR